MQVMTYAKEDELIILPMKDGMPVGEDEIFGEGKENKGEYKQSVLDFPIVVHAGVDNGYPMLSFC